MKPIDDWRQAGRLWSVRICALATAFFLSLMIFTEQAHQVWLLLPAAVQERIPGHEWIALFFFIMIAVARVLRQPGQPPAAPPSLSLRHDGADVVLVGSGQVDGSLIVDEEPRA